MNHFPSERVRAKFPALLGDGAGTPPAFLDNPAGTQVPGSVIDAVAAAMVSAASNHGGFFPSSRTADATWEQAHEAMADLLGAASMREIVIGPSMTNLTFAMSRVLGRRFRAGDEIIVTRMDHEANVSPWLALAADLGLTVRWLPFNRETFRIEEEDLATLLGERTRLLALNYSSNLTGSINDVKRLVAMASEAGALSYVDAVQFAPHGLVDVQALGCDFLACSSYKFFGPHLGIVWGREDLLAGLQPYKVRCASDDLPACFETGTSQTELLAGLSAAVDYIAWVGQAHGAGGSRRARIAAAYTAAIAHESTLALRLIDGVKSLPRTTVHGITNPNRIAERVPTVSITCEGHHPRDIARALAERDIYVWSGHNYAFEVVKHLGIDPAIGVVRIGLAHYNTADEVERVLSALADIVT